jgi:hypothetical protein
LAAWTGLGDLYLSLALLVAGRAKVCAGTSKINGQDVLFSGRMQPDWNLGSMGSHQLPSEGLGAAREVKVGSQA